MRKHKVYEYLHYYSTHDRLRPSSKDYNSMLDLWDSFTPEEKAYCNKILTSGH